MRSAFPEAIAYASPTVAVVGVLAWPGVSFETRAGGALFALLVPLVLLHLLLAPGRPRTVASLDLYLDSVPLDSKRRFRFWPFWTQPEFWLRASIINVIALAAMSPTWLSNQTTPLVLILDRSATLAQPSHDGSTSDALLRHEARAWVESWRGPIALLSGSFDVSHYSPLGSSRQHLRDAMEKLPAADGWGGLPAVLREAERVRAAAGPNSIVVLISDNIDGSADRALREGPLWPHCERGLCRHVVVDARPKAWFSLHPSRVFLSTREALDVVVRASEDTVWRPGAAVLASREGATETKSSPISSEGTATLRLPWEGCWTLRLQGDGLGVVDPVYVFTSSTTNYCVLQREPNIEGPIVDLARAEDPRALVLPYESGALADASCNVAVLIDPPDERWLENRSMLGTNALIVYAQPGGEPAGTVAHVEDAFDGALTQLEPRLLQLAPIPARAAKPSDQILISLVGRSTDALDAAAMLRNQAERTVVQIGVSRDGLATDSTKAMVAVILRWLGRLNAPELTVPISTGVVRPSALEQVCGPTQAGPRLMAGVFMQRGSRGVIQRLFSATAIDPGLRRLNGVPSAVRSSENTSTTGSVALLWPIACWLGLILMLAEQQRQA